MVSESRLKNCKFKTACIYIAVKNDTHDTDILNFNRPTVFLVVIWKTLQEVS